MRLHDRTAMFRKITATLITLGLAAGFAFGGAGPAAAYIIIRGT